MNATESSVEALSATMTSANSRFVFSNKELRDELSKLNADVMGSDTDPFYGAPQVLIVLADKSIGTYVYDGSLVMGNMMNAAEDLGISSCWIHRAKEVFASEEGKLILRRLGISGDYEGIGNLVIGYDNGGKREKVPRKDNYVYWDGNLPYVSGGSQIIGIDGFGENK